MLKASIPYILILIVSFFTWRPLLGLGYFSMHDDQQIVRLAQLDKSLVSGQFPVRWVSDLGFGYGYSLFNFYPPLTYYLGEVFHLAGFDLISSTKLVWFVALLGSGFAMYLLSKEFFGEIGGLVSATFYLYAPYHAVDAYVRGALAELFSFVWLPLILWAVYKKRAVLAGLLLGLLMITHNLIFLPFVGFYLLWALVFYPKSMFISLPLAFGLTAFFWLPSLAEKQFTLVDQLLIKNLAAYSLHFVCPSQLWNSLWGYGGSVAGCLDGMSFSLGKIYILASLLATVVLIRQRRLLIIPVLLALSVFLTINYSKFIWDLISPLWYLQFPWRFLEFTALFSALLAGMLRKPIVAIPAIIAVLFFNAKHFAPQKYYLDATDARLTSDYNVKWQVSSSSFEYLPKGVTTKVTALGTVWVDITPTEVQSTKYKVQRGDFVTKGERFLPHEFKIIGDSKQGATLQMGTTNFPGWKVWVDGKETPIDDNNKYKLITVSVPAGERNIVGRFTNTPVRTAGNLTSLAFVLGISALYGIRRSKK